MSKSKKHRAGLTLMELLVVLAILVILATLIIPRITGVSEQANTASNAALIQGINEAEARYEAQFGKIPSAWDGLLTSGGALYSKLHPKILSGALDGDGAAGTTLTPITLDATQAQSLIDAGLTGVHFQDEGWAGFPSESGRDYAAIAKGVKLLSLNVGSVGLFDGAAFDAAGGHNTMFCDRAFSINPFTPSWLNTFIVVGFGNETGLKRNAVLDTPLFNSAQPAQNYARGLCVFMVPPAGTALTDKNYFKAQYVGCFAPDGTCMMDNLDNYNKQQVPQ